MGSERRQMSDEEKIPLEARGVAWPLTVYVCQTCCRPTLFKEDKCCQGFVVGILVMPIAREIEEYLIEELDLTTRAYNNLKRANIDTVGQLLSKSRGWVQAIPNMGVLAMRSVDEALAAHDLKLKEELNDDNE